MRPLVSVTDTGVMRGGYWCSRWVTGSLIRMKVSLGGHPTQGAHMAAAVMDVPKWGVKCKLARSPDKTSLLQNCCTLSKKNDLWI